MRATDLLLIGFLFVHLLPTGFCQKFCAPRAVVTSLVRATVYRSGRTLPDICGTAYDEFRIQLEYVAVRNMELGKGCSVVSLPVGHECSSSERKAVVDIPVNLTCNDECIPFESSRQLELLSRMHRNRLVGEVRRRQTKEAVIQGQRVRLVYKKGPKTYFEYCPAGVASTVDSNLLCDCGTRCCFGDLVFSECASPCPRTCDNIFGPPVACLAICLQGCACPDNMVQDGNKCMLPTECPNSQCLLPPDVGTGRAVLRDYYYYNGENQRCERLRYSGCGGNENHFRSELQCQAQCSDPRCRGDYVLTDCATSCGLSCENYHLPLEQRPLCGGFCFEGCFCPPGLIPVRTDGENNECAKPEECPRALCPRGQIFRHCAGNCGLSCENHHLPPRLRPVSDFCFPGCSCEDGLIPAGPYSDRCVPPDRCWTAVCTMRRQSRPCNESESTVRYYFNQARGRCQRFYGCRERGINNFRSLEDCRDRCEPTQRPQRPTISPPQTPPRPSPTPSTPECPGVKEYRECGTACPRTCGNINTTFGCTLQCVQGCFCPRGLVEYGEHCVPPQFCPSEISRPPRPSPTPGTPQCPGVKEFNECGTACPLTCDNPGPQICTFQCVRGCFCPSGLVELDDTCVPAEFCPNQDDGSAVGTTAIPFTGEPPHTEDDGSAVGTTAIPFTGESVVTGDPPVTGEPPHTEDLPKGGRPTGPPSSGRPTGPPPGWKTNRTTVKWKTNRTTVKRKTDRTTVGRKTNRTIITTTTSYVSSREEVQFLRYSLSVHL
ncbi:PI-actitoxin-Axm2b [Geodia barretti]|uniref:PI-actitoxin-Axm2b n=1 Tax=Geodia barretti TaxID=519541 RepID=A0AA35R688_GEOBA|nr:PI-actitoxin-Axm2b [Geodia barretti]